MDGRSNVGHRLGNTRYSAGMPAVDPGPAMDDGSVVGWPCGNARYGGGVAGTEHRFKFPAVDEQMWDEAKATMTAAGKWQGESGQVIGAYVNTMDGPGRGAIMGTQGPGPWPDRAFTEAGGGPRPNPGMCC